MAWVILLVSLLVLQSSNVKCQDQFSTVGAAFDGGSNRRRPLADPNHEHLGRTEPSGGLYFDTADWSKEAEKWSFKGGDWGLVTLPDDDYPHIPQPSVPGPVLIAEGNSMKKVIVSRSLSGLENVSLHFSYFLTNNPNSSPQLQVVQLQGDSNEIVWPSDADIGNVAYGQWTDGSVQLLPFNGDFDIKFIGQRIVDTNDIGLDDIILRGTYRDNNVGDGVLRGEANVTDTPSIVSQSENDTNSNVSKVDITTVSSVISENNNTVSKTEDQVSSNSSLITENPILNSTGTSDPNNVSNQSLTNAPGNLTSNDAPNNDTNIAPSTTAKQGSLTTLDTADNTTNPLVITTSIPDNNLTVSNISTVTSLNNETVTNISTNNPQNVSSASPSLNNSTILSNITTAIPSINVTVGDNTTSISQNVTTDHQFQNITSQAPNSNFTNFPLENSTLPIQNITNPSVDNSTQFPSTRNNTSIIVTGPDGIEGTGSPPVEEASWGVFKILLSITVLGGCVLIFLYWRRSRQHDDEIALYSRSLHTDYHNPTFQDDISPDEGLTGRGTPYNYKSFN